MKKKKKVSRDQVEEEWGSSLRVNHEKLHQLRTAMHHDNRDGEFGFSLCMV